MPINLRRLSRSRPRQPDAAPAVDARLTHALRRLIGAERARILPTDNELDALAEVKPADIDRAMSLWDASQQEAGTGLDGLLSATEARED